MVLCVCNTIINTLLSSLPLLLNIIVCTYKKLLSITGVCNIIFCETLINVRLLSNCKVLNCWELRQLRANAQKSKNKKTLQNKNKMISINVKGSLYLFVTIDFRSNVEFLSPLGWQTKKKKQKMEKINDVSETGVRK